MCCIEFHPLCARGLKLWYLLLLTTLLIGLNALQLLYLSIINSFIHLSLMAARMLYRSLIDFLFIILSDIHKVMSFSQKKIKGVSNRNIYRRHFSLVLVSHQFRLRKDEFSLNISLFILNLVSLKSSEYVQQRFMVYY